MRFFYGESKIVLNSLLRKTGAKFDIDAYAIETFIREATILEHKKFSKELYKMLVDIEEVIPIKGFNFNAYDDGFDNIEIMCF